LTDRLTVGVVGRRHGVRGHFRVHSHSGETLHLKELVEVGIELAAGVRNFAVEEVRILGDGVLMKLVGVDTPEAARELVGSQIWVDREHAAALAEDEFYVVDLIGCRVEHQGTGPCGKVTAVLPAGGGDVLEITDGDKEALMIPFRKEYVARVDLLSGMILLAEDVDVS
jgi:16S rRNA processing protein RimM